MKTMSDLKMGRPLSGYNNAHLQRRLTVTKGREILNRTSTDGILVAYNVSQSQVPSLARPNTGSNKLATKTSRYKLPTRD